MELYNIVVKTRENKDFALKTLEGKVLLIVNTATGCGFTPQYEAIEKLYEKYHEQGFEVLDFPCNQFGHQAPGSDEEIKNFCTAKYDTKFDQLKKIDVNGENESPLFTLLKRAQPDEKPEGLKNKLAMKTVKKISKTCQKKGDIVWNFTKFIVDKKGNVVGRFDPTYDPAKLDNMIAKLLRED
jgi:glutathione peroxidase